MRLSSGFVLIERFGQQLGDDFADGTAVLLLQVLDLLQDGIVYVDRRSGHDELILIKIASDVNTKDDEMPEIT